MAYTWILPIDINAVKARLVEVLDDVIHKSVYVARIHGLAESVVRRSRC